MKTLPRARRQSVWGGSMLMITLLAFAWRILDLDKQSLWRDEIDAIYFALQDLPALLSMFTKPGQNGPLYFLILRPWFNLVGTSEFALRYPSAIAGSLSIPLMWQVGRRLIPVRIIRAGRQSNAVPGRDIFHRLATSLRMIFQDPSFLATLLLAVNPYQLWYAQEGKMYALVTFLALLAVWFWLLGIGHGGWQPWVGLLVTVSLAIYSHLLMVLLIPLFVIWFVLAWPQSKRHWVGFTLFLVGLTVPYIPLIWWQWSLLTASEISTAVSFTPPGMMLNAILLYQSNGVLPPTHLGWLLPIFFFGLNGFLQGFRVASLQLNSKLPHLAIWRRYLLIISWLIIPVLSIYLLSLRQPLFMPRYVLWIAPAFMMLIALGIHFVWQNSSERMRPLLVVLLIYMVGYWGYIGWQEKNQQIKADLRNAVRFVSQQRKPSELIILQTPYLENAYRYYSSDQGSHPFAGSDERLGWWAGGLWTNNGLADDEAWKGVEREMGEKTDGASEIWLIQSESTLWDARGFMMSWLNHHATLIQEVNYHSTQVLVFRK